MSNFHTENIASILNKFDSNMDQGLSAEALEKAKARYGKNEFASEKKIFPIKAFLEPLLTWRIIVLALATVILVAFFLQRHEQRYPSHGRYRRSSVSYPYRIRLGNSVSHLQPECQY
jgi:magnesium-transporting ATPase (P-type)